MGGEEEVLYFLLSDTGIMKLLILLMAPVAMESSQYTQELISSDPRGLLVRLNEKTSIYKGLVWSG